MRLCRDPDRPEAAPTTPRGASPFQRTVCQVPNGWLPGSCGWIGRLSTDWPKRLTSHVRCCPQAGRPRAKPVAGRPYHSCVTTLQLYGTATRSQREFHPVRSGTASIYVCGATVQGIPHLGHVRSGLNFDVLARWLAHGGADVFLV